jgi:hypothetical protein
VVFISGKTKDDEKAKLGADEGLAVILCVFYVVFIFLYGILD